MSGSGNEYRRERATTSLSRLLALIAEQTLLDPLPLRPGCNPSALSELEQTLGASLPEDYRALLRSFDGQENQPELEFPPDGLRFLAHDEVVALWRDFVRYRDDDRFVEQLRDEDRVRSVLYHEGRVPIAYNESGGVYLCLDRIPGPAGRRDQLVFNVDEIDCVVLEWTVADLLERYVELLDSGRAVVERQPPEYGQGFWFASSGRHVDYALYRELTLV